MPEKEIKDLFDNSPESNNLFFRLYKKYGYDVETLGKPGVFHDFSVIPYAEAEAFLLQNAFNRNLSTTETIRLILDGRILMEQILNQNKGPKPKSTS